MRMSSPSELQARSLPPNHRCRVDDLAYASVSDWFGDHVGRVPIQAAAALTAHMKAYECSFAEAFTALTNGGPIILIERERSAGSDPP
jgi:hypothetical protein